MQNRQTYMRRHAENTKTSSIPSYGDRQQCVAQCATQQKNSTEYCHRICPNHLPSPSSSWEPTTKSTKPVASMKPSAWPTGPTMRNMQPTAPSAWPWTSLTPSSEPWSCANPQSFSWAPTYGRRQPWMPLFSSGGFDERVCLEAASAQAAGDPHALTLGKYACTDAYAAASDIYGDQGPPMLPKTYYQQR